MMSGCWWPTQPAIEISGSRIGSKVGRIWSGQQPAEVKRTYRLAQVKEIEFLDLTPFIVRSSLVRQNQNHPFLRFSADGNVKERDHVNLYASRLQTRQR